MIFKVGDVVQTIAGDQRPWNIDGVNGDKIACWRPMGNISQGGTFNATDLKLYEGLDANGNFRR